MSWVTKSAVLRARRQIDCSSSCSSSRVWEFERAERLVHQHDVRVEREQPRQRDPLLHAAAQLARIEVGEAREVNEIEIFARLGQSARAWAGPSSRAASDVLDRGEPGKQRELLEHHAAIGAGRPDRTAVEPQLARRSPARSRRRCAGTCSCRIPKARRWRRTRARRWTSDSRSIAVTLRLSTVNVLSRSFTSSSGIVTGLVNSGQLVSRFRRSCPFAARARTNVGTKGTLATI